MMAELNASINRSSGGDHEDEWRHQFYRKLVSAHPIIISLISAIEIVIMIFTLYALCALIKSQRSTPVFVIHLILSDLIQIICRLTWTIAESREARLAYYYCLIVGVYFMTCVALERYLLVCHPIWYRSHHSLKVCCVISVIVWFVPLIFIDFKSYYNHSLFDDLPRAIGCLIPYPIIILCFIGTSRGLSRAISLTSVKRKKILGSMFLVLLTYTFLILPYTILIFTIDYRVHSYNYSKALLHIFWHFFSYLLFLNPLADCVLYLFIRPDVGGLMKSVDCCCSTDRHQDSTLSRDEHSRDNSVAFACCVSVLMPASHSRTCPSVSTSALHT